MCVCLEWNGVSRLELMSSRVEWSSSFYCIAMHRIVAWMPALLAVCIFIRRLLAISSLVTFAMLVFDSCTDAEYQMNFLFYFLCNFRTLFCFFNFWICILRAPVVYTLYTFHEFNVAVVAVPFIVHIYKRLSFCLSMYTIVCLFNHLGINFNGMPCYTSIGSSTLFMYLFLFFSLFISFNLNSMQFYFKLNYSFVSFYKRVTWQKINKNKTS